MEGSASGLYRIESQPMESTSYIIYIVAALSSLLCCGGAFLIFLLILGFVFLRKRGKKDISVKEAMSTGADMSRAFIRGGKTREQLLAEEEEEERKGR